jgi:hypothetical protein
MMNMLLTLLSISGLGEFGLSMDGSRFLPERLSDLCQGLSREIASGSK